MRIVYNSLLGHWSYIVKGRSKRPQEFTSSGISSLHENTPCVFCPGNEHLTPPEIGRMEDGRGGWLMRWFPNKFPAVAPDSEEAYGRHEIIVETPDTQKQLWDFTQEEAARLFLVYQERVKNLKQDERIKAVAVFKNHGKEAGTSLLHSHSQMVATSVLPSRLARMANNSDKNCFLCALGSGENVIAENEEFIAITPEAPRISLEAWIAAKDHGNRFDFYSQGTLNKLVSLLQKFLLPLKTIQAPYCFYFLVGKNDSDSHFHIEILPRIQVWGGFELACGDYIITTPPEVVVQFYQGIKE